MGRALVWLLCKASNRRHGPSGLGCFRRLAINLVPERGDQALPMVAGLKKTVDRTALARLSLGYRSKWTCTASAARFMDHPGPGRKSLPDEPGPAVPACPRCPDWRNESEPQRPAVVCGFTQKLPDGRPMDQVIFREGRDPSWSHSRKSSLTLTHILRSAVPCWPDW